MARYKRIIRTTFSVEDQLRFIDEIVAQLGIAERRWNHRELQEGGVRETQVGADIKRTSWYIRFKGSIGMNHFLISVRLSRIISGPLYEEGVSSRTNRIWVKHQLGSRPPHWRRFLHDGVSFTQMHTRKESHD